MTRTTRKQREALKSVFDRGPVLDAAGSPINYRTWRRGVQGTIGCDGAVVIGWCGMFLCIERDGYVHS